MLCTEYLEGERNSWILKEVFPNMVILSWAPKHKSKVKVSAEFEVGEDTLKA